MSHRLRLYPYCGGHAEYAEYAEGEEDECRRRAARRIRVHRNRFEYPVSVLERGRRWELQSDPDGMSLVGDGEGILAIEEVPEPEPPDDEDDPSADLCGRCFTTLDDDEFVLCDRCVEEACGSCGLPPEECRCTGEGPDE